MEESTVGRLKTAAEVAAAKGPTISLEEVRQRLGPVLMDNRPDAELEYNLPAITMAVLDWAAAMLQEAGADSLLREMRFPLTPLPRAPVVRPVREGRPVPPRRRWS